MKSFFALLIALIFALAFADSDFYNAENPTECAPPGEKELFFQKYNVTTGGPYTYSQAKHRFSGTGFGTIHPFFVIH
jgi:hypothetical protein